MKHAKSESPGQSTKPEAQRTEESLPNVAIDQSGQKKARPRRKRRVLVVIIIVFALVVMLGMGAWLGYLILGANSQAEGFTGWLVEVTTPGKQVPAPTPEEIRIMDAIEAGAAPDDPDISRLPTPLIATYGDLLIHSPIFPRDLTEIEYHQASYDTALPMKPLLTIVDTEETMEKHGTNHILWEDQPYGNVPLIGEAVSTWRLDSVGEEMTSVDVGAKAGTWVYAPVTGTVVKIRTYSLYDLIDDYEVHIQSPDHPELDIVVLHIDQLTIKVGDEVFGGCTRIGKVRDMGEDIDSNLMNFTMPPDPGNHCHVQVNDATRADYPGLVGALDIFGGRGFVRPEAPAAKED